ncbi:MAG: hypothetical protein II822_09250 [Prevotella sp.]|nr:hypothetical protein [Prevotella sp.]
MKEKDDNKKKTKKKPDGEHKPSWQEKWATPEEIKRMLGERVLLRYNEVRHRTEVHWLSQGPVIGEDEQGLLTIFGGYVAVHRSGVEMEAYRRKLAEKDSAKMTDDSMTDVY